jgi:predicted DCC family thiol-disulfide oxidoreductase YuxK
VLDAAYDAIAARRYAWFGRKRDSCPVIPVSMRSRIEP